MQDVKEGHCRDMWHGMGLQKQIDCHTFEYSSLIHQGSNHPIQNVMTDISFINMRNPQTIGIAVIFF